MSKKHASLRCAASRCCWSKNCSFCNKIQTLCSSLCIRFSSAIRFVDVVIVVGRLCRVLGGGVWKMKSSKLKESFNDAFERQSSLSAASSSMCRISSKNASNSSVVQKVSECCCCGCTPSQLLPSCVFPPTLTRAEVTGSAYNAKGSGVDTAMCVSKQLKRLNSHTHTQKGRRNIFFFR